MRIELFSDIACPFCYIGTRQFAEALRAVPGKDEVEVVWRSFQLDPSAPPRAEGDLIDHLSRKFDVSRDEAKAMNDRVISMGHGVGIEFDFESAFAANTFDAHRMLQLAATEGREATLAEGMFAAYFTGSKDISDPDSLTEIAAGAGVDEARAREVAHGDEFSSAVRSDQELAGALGITGVPAFVFDRRSAFSGARPADQIQAVIEAQLAA